MMIQPASYAVAEMGISHLRLDGCEDIEICSIRFGGHDKRVADAVVILLVLRAESPPAVHGIDNEVLHFGELSSGARPCVRVDGAAAAEIITERPSVRSVVGLLVGVALIVGNGV